MASSNRSSREQREREDRELSVVWSTKRCEPIEHTNSTVESSLQGAHRMESGFFKIE